MSLLHRANGWRRKFLKVTHKFNRLALSAGRLILSLIKKLQRHPFSGGAVSKSGQTVSI